jgi:hypothetical protein
MMKRTLLAGLLFGALTIPLSAATVSFLVMETGLSGESGSSSWSGLWESGLLDVFFEAGHIVSNAPIKRLGLKPQKTFPDEAQADLDEAAAGGAEYFILALLDYPPQVGEEIPQPRSIDLQIFSISPRRLLYKQQYSGGADRNPKDEFARIKKSVRELVPHVQIDG